MTKTLTKLEELGMLQMARRAANVLDSVNDKYADDVNHEEILHEMFSFITAVETAIDKFLFVESNVLETIKIKDSYTAKTLCDIDKEYMKQVRIDIHSGGQPQSGNLLEINDRRRVLKETYPLKLQIFGINEAGHQDHMESGWHIRSENGFTGFYRPVIKKENCYYAGYVKLERYNDNIQIVKDKIIR